MRRAPPRPIRSVFKNDLACDEREAPEDDGLLKMVTGRHSRSLGLIFFSSLSVFLFSYIPVESCQI
jgi:hypothetical protein